jgi:molybdopterin-guanine dinucleotide biosynthesis adapter protein
MYGRSPSRFRQDEPTLNILGIVGWKNSGKTTLIEKLVAEFTARNLRVSTIKHTHHDFEIDLEGKDSYRHRMAGASEVLVISSRRWALLHEIRDEIEPPFEQLVASLSPCDLLLVEGYKQGAHPKLEVIRTMHPKGLIANQDESVIAVATDNFRLATHHRCLPLNDPLAIANFITCHFQRWQGT